MLERSSLILFLMLFAAASASAQSGRRVAPTPKPTPVAQTRDDAPNYSESKPNPPRPQLMPIAFPG
ncbi:MAG: hypothetical protein IPG67_00325 [Acidobacteria bacterium]|nr:hypothetical protein [Acidobacteriota bacterium]